MRNNNDDSVNLTIKAANPERKISDLRSVVLELWEATKKDRALILTTARASIVDAWTQGWNQRCTDDESFFVSYRTLSQILDAFDKSVNFTSKDANPERKVLDFYREVLELKATVSKERALILTEARATIVDAWTQGWNQRCSKEEPFFVPYRTLPEILEEFDDSVNFTINDENPERQVRDLCCEILELRESIRWQRAHILDLNEVPRQH